MSSSPSTGRARADTLEALMHGKMRASSSEPRMEYRPSKTINGYDVIPGDFYANSILDIDLWFRNKGLHDYDVTLLFNPNEPIIFEMRAELQPYRAIRQKYGKSISDIVDSWKAKARVAMRRLSHADRSIATFCTGDVKFCRKERDRIIFLPRFTDQFSRVQPQCVPELSSLELRHLQVDLLAFIDDVTDKSQYGFSLTFSMGTWRMSRNAHIKIRFNEPDLVKNLRKKL